MKSKALLLSCILLVVSNQIFATTEKASEAFSEILEFTSSTFEYSKLLICSEENSLSSDRYIIKVEVILAATSKESFDMLNNCLANNDKEALKEMIINKQLIYLYRNNVVFLVEPKLLYYIVRKEGSTKLLYVDPSFLQKQ